MAGVSFYSIREIRRSRALITENLPSLSDYVKEGEGGEIIIRGDLDMLLKAVGSHMAASLKAGVMGMLSGQARLDKGLKGAFVESAVQNQMPLLALAGEIFGIPVEKYLKKHPEAIMQLAPLAQKFMGGSKGGFDINSLMRGGMPPSERHGNDGLGGYG